eukprot:6372130-Prymnesium_polylepis.1
MTGCRTVRHTALRAASSSSRVPLFMAPHLQRLQVRGCPCLWGTNPGGARTLEGRELFAPPAATAPRAQGA